MDVEKKSRLLSLPERMRPRTLDEVIGQDELIGENGVLGCILGDSDLSVPSFILVGAPGCGKTSIAKIIAEDKKWESISLSGVLDGVKEIKESVNSAKNSLRHFGKRTVVLVDEIHRFNRAQQDAFLPHVESGIISIIGLSTENVSFRIRGALLSRLHVIELKTIASELVNTLLLRALKDDERGLGAWGLDIEREGLELLSRRSGGDLRRALLDLEWAAISARSRSMSIITCKLLEDVLGKNPHYYDQKGDCHYDCISAFIKSMRGSDPDAALYYMLRALKAGEDPLFISRRMIIFASEDACCDPRALEIAINVDRAVERIGMPEAKISLAHGVVYLSCCAKSNASYMALRSMEKHVESKGHAEIPMQLRNAPNETMKALGRGEGYEYPHDYPDAFVPKSYLPSELKGLKVYHPNERGIEIKIAEKLRRLRALVEEAGK